MRSFSLSLRVQNGCDAHQQNIIHSFILFCAIFRFATSSKSMHMQSCTKAYFSITLDPYMSSNHIAKNLGSVQLFMLFTHASLFIITDNVYVSWVMFYTQL